MSLNRLFRLSSFVILFGLFTLLQTPHLEAGGWGKTDDVLEHEKMLWNGVFFDMNGLHFAAFLPNYTGGSLENGWVYLRGQADKDVNYSISTTFNKGYNPPNSPPKSLDEFLFNLESHNPDCIVIPVDTKRLGKVKYAADLIPKNPNSGRPWDRYCWRFICTGDRVIRMGTDDANHNRQLYFFDSIYIY